MGRIWYFSYGRNMNSSKLYERIKRKPFSIYRGRLLNYKLIFGKVPGPKLGTGYATIVPSPKESVEGVLYLLNGQDLEVLDKYEGVETGNYIRCKVEVLNLDLNIIVKAYTYIAVKVDENLKPPREYLAELIESSKRMSLTNDWIIKLENLMKDSL